MSRIFADSFYFFALINERDQAHARALEWTNAFQGRMFTTEWVLLEVADGIARSPARATFHLIREDILDSRRHVVVPFDTDFYEAGLELYAARSDKQWSLTDCISFVVMQREGLTDALTGDRHFEQAGFRALFA